MRDRGFDRLPHPGQVDVDHVCPVCFTCAVQRLATIADSGVRADDVQSTQLLDPAVDRRFDRVVVPDIDLGGHDATIQTA